jgi:DNA-binding YbaB/EbfC family protein
MGSGFSKMKKQARMMQEQMSQLRGNLQNIMIEGSAGSGLVTVTLNGEKELKKIIIKPECLSDVEGLQDLIVGAFQDASRKVDAQQPSSPFPF